MKDLYQKYFMKQQMMRPLIYFLSAIGLYAIYLYGWRVLVLLLVNMLVAVAVEYLCEKKMYGRKKISEAVIVTSLLYTMTLPASIPLWMSIVGIIVAVFFGKMVFGGFGRNVFNPALVGRAFIYINFPEPMTIHWNQAASGFPGGFGQYLTPVIDDVSRATPMLLFRNSGEFTPTINLVLGNIAGVIGEAPKIILFLAAAYLIYKKIASWQIMAGSVLGFSVLSLVFYLQGVSSVPNPLMGMLMGGFIFGTVLMATDPISAAKTVKGKWLYGIIVGMITVIIRGFALFSGGMMFAILIGNMFAPIIDYFVRKSEQKKKERQVKVHG